MPAETLVKGNDKWLQFCAAITHNIFNVHEVSKELTPELKQQRDDACEGRYQAEGDVYLKSMVTADES